MHKVLMHAGAISRSLYGFASVQEGNPLPRPVLPAKSDSDSDVMICLQIFQELIIDISRVC